MVHPDSHKVSRAPWYSGTERKEPHLSPTGLSPSSAALSSDLRLGGFFVTSWLAPAPPHNPPRTEALEVWAVPLSLAATDGIADLLSFPPGTEMVHFPGFASPCLCIQQGISQLALRGVAPFGNPRIEACLRLPEAYRSLPRPSSLLCAKASTVHP